MDPSLVLEGTLLHAVKLIFLSGSEAWMAEARGTLRNYNNEISGTMSLCMA